MRGIGDCFCLQSSDCEEELDPASWSAKGDTLLEFLWLEGGFVGVILAAPKLWVKRVMLVSVRIISP